MSRRSRAVSLAPVNYRSAYRGQEADPEAESLLAAGLYAFGKIEVVHGTAIDPVALTGGVKRDRPVARNRKVDVLEYEFHCGRIQAPAYAAGLALQRVAEAAGKFSLAGGSLEPSCGKGDTDAALRRRIVACRTLVQWHNDMRSIVRKELADVVYAVIVEMRGFADIAVGRGMMPWRAREIAKEFRDSLEEIALEWERRGHY